MQHRMNLVAMTLTRVVMLMALPLFVAGCAAGATPLPPTPLPTTASLPTAAPRVQEKNPETVLRAITDALNKKDVEAATALLADDVTQTLIPAPSGTGVYQGKDAMHARFKEVVAANPTHKIISCQTSGDKVTCAATYTDDSIEPLGFDLEFNVEAVVQNGLLKTVTWKMTDQSLAKMQAAMASTPAPTATLQPEVLASSVNDITGVWKTSCGGEPILVEFKMGGTSVITLVSTYAGISSVAFPYDYSFDAGQIKWTGYCTGTPTPDTVKQCTAVYKTYVMKQGDQVATIRFELISANEKMGMLECFPNRTAKRVGP